jgi:hypothetical protein
MWRKVTTGSVAAAGVWLMGTGVAQANGWFFGNPTWPPVWETAVKVEALSAPAPVADGCPIESADGLSLFIASNRSDADPTVVGDPNNIWVSDRVSIGAPWQPPQKIGEPISLAGPADFCPTPVRGRSLMFVSTRVIDGVSCGDGDMYISRQSPAGGWSAPVNLGCAPSGPNTAGAERSPSLVETPYGTFLFYSSNETPGLDQNIRVSVMRKDGTFGPGKVVEALSTPSEDIMPNVRERELGGYEVVYSSNRAGVNAADQDVYIAFAWFLPGPWSRPVNVGSAVNTPATEQRSTLSHDGKRLYFGRSGDIFVSRRVR